MVRLREAKLALVSRQAVVRLTVSNVIAFANVDPKSGLSDLRKTLNADLRFKVVSRERPRIPPRIAIADSGKPVERFPELRAIGHRLAGKRIHGRPIPSYLRSAIFVFRK